MTATNLAQQAVEKAGSKPEEIIPSEYLRHQKIFSEQASQRFPPSREWDHAIDLLPNAPSSIHCKVYPMPRHEGDTLDKFLQEQRESNYIRPSKSPYAAPLFFVGKKDGDLQPVQDYRTLNSYTVKNNHPVMIQRIVA